MVDSVAQLTKEELSKIIDNIAHLFVPLKKELDKYPKAFSLSVNSDGYIIEVDYDLLKPCQGVQVP